MAKYESDVTYDPIRGRSDAIVKHKGYVYQASVCYNAEDKDEYPMSSFLGCRIAEKKAFIKALKAEAKKKEQMLRAIMDFFEKTETENIPDRQAKEIEHMRKDLDTRRKRIKQIEKSIDKDIKEYIDFQEKRKDKKESCE